MNNSKYRVVFDKDLLPPQAVPDVDVASVQPVQMLPVSFFIEKNRSLQATKIEMMGATATAGSPVTPSGAPFPNRIFLGQNPPSPLIHDPLLNSNASVARAKSDSKQEDRIGLYPAKLLLQIVRLEKLLKQKQVYVMQLQVT